MSPVDSRDEIPASDRHLSYLGLAVPVSSAILIVSLVLFFAGGDAAMEVVGTALATATVAGKFVVIRGIHQQGFFDSPYKLALLVVYLDLAVALIAIYNIGILYRIPRFGRKIQEMQRNGKRILARNPWMGKVTFIGIVAFVMFPLSGTGAIGGSIFARLLGVSRVRTLVAIAIGSVLGAFLMALLADLFGETLQRFQDNPFSLVGGLAAIALAVWWLIRIANRAALGAEDEESEEAIAEERPSGSAEREEAV
ncbi:MAG: small multi-drug export protein [Planctomycetota bacterium]